MNQIVIDTFDIDWELYKSRLNNFVVVYQPYSEGTSHWANRVARYEYVSDE